MPPTPHTDAAAWLRPITPLVPSRVRTILLQSNDPRLPGQYVTKVTDGLGAIVQCLRVDRVPQSGQVLSLMCPDPSYGRVRFLCRVLRSVGFRTEAHPGMNGDHFAVMWLAVTALGRRDYLADAMKAVGISPIPDLTEFPAELPTRQELIYHAAKSVVELVTLQPGRRKVATEKLSYVPAQIPDIN